MQWLATQLGAIWDRLFAAIQVMWTAAWRWMTNIWLVLMMIFTFVATVLLNAATVLGKLTSAVIAGSFAGSVATEIQTAVAFLNSIVPLYEGCAFAALIFAQRLVLAAYRFAKSWLPTLTGA